MEKKHFLFLLSLNASNAKVGKAVLEKVKRDLDVTASPLWIDAHGLGIFISTDLSAWNAWRKLFPETLSRDEQMLMRDGLLVQVGPDYAGPRDAKTTAWLNSRFPKPS